MVRPPKTSYSLILGVRFPQGTMYWWLFVLMILTCLISTHQPLCDEVKLSSGDVLKGTIVEHNEVPLGDFRVDLRVWGANYLQRNTYVCDGSKDNID